MPMQSTADAPTSRARAATTTSPSPGIRAEAAALGVELPAEESERRQVLALERRTDLLRRDAARQRFARVPFGLGLVLAYLILLEAEVDDLIRLLEAKAQKLDDEAVRAYVPREVT